VKCGFIGLGNMGAPMAANLAATGCQPIVYDKAGTAERAPEGAIQAASLAEVTAAETVFLSLPDGPVVAAVAAEIAASNQRRTTAVIDTSTIGVEAAQSIWRELDGAGIGFCDAPVSGGTAGAKAGTVAIMFSGPRAIFDSLTEPLAAMGNPFYVGAEAGQGQAMKLLNNYLSATAMAATSEAISFGLSAGLDPSLMVEILNASSGQNTATADKFPNRIIPGKYDAGFTNTLLKKDLKLYLAGVQKSGTPRRLGENLVALWRDFHAAQPDADFTRIFPFVKDQ
jgi:3-hydroxyisobutyrate dehydrogenase-like beta-hydroxyacid dehydrogenase